MFLIFRGVLCVLQRKQPLIPIQTPPPIPFQSRPSIPVKTASAMRRNFGRSGRSKNKSGIKSGRLRSARRSNEMFFYELNELANERAVFGTSVLSALLGAYKYSTHLKTT